MLSPRCPDEIDLDRPHDNCPTTWVVMWRDRHGDMDWDCVVAVDEEEAIQLAMDRNNLSCIRRYSSSMRAYREAM